MKRSKFGINSFSLLFTWWVWADWLNECLRQNKIFFLIFLLSFFLFLYIGSLNSYEASPKPLNTSHAYLGPAPVFVRSLFSVLGLERFVTLNIEWLTWCFQTTNQLIVFLYFTNSTENAPAKKESLT
jgi:hypothetical protein